MSVPIRRSAPIAKYCLPALCNATHCGPRYRRVNYLSFVYLSSSRWSGIRTTFSVTSLHVKHLSPWRTRSVKAGRRSGSDIAQIYLTSACAESDLLLAAHGTSRALGRAGRGAVNYLARAAAQLPIAPSHCPSGLLRFAISSQEPPPRPGWRWPASRAPARPYPTQPAPCRPPADGVLRPASGPNNQQGIEDEDQPKWRLGFRFTILAAEEANLRSSAFRSPSQLPIPGGIDNGRF
jgi:hypothetical protein